MGTNNYNENEENMQQETGQLNDPQGNRQSYNQRQENQQVNDWQQGYNRQVYAPPYADQSLDHEKQDHRIISRVALGLFIMGLAVVLAQLLVQKIVGAVNPDLFDSGWYVWALTAFSIIGVGLPTFYLMTRKIPDSPKAEAVRLKPLTFFGIFLVCAAAMYITNFFSVFLTFFIALLKGQNFMDMNPLTDLFTGSNFWLAILYTSVAAPIVEEVIFRKLLLDKLRRYGDLPAILMSGIAFGLFHMNLSQFFYATALGMIFAYVAIRTNTIRYNVLLHIMINLIGSSASYFVTKPNILASVLMVTWVFTAIAAGVVIFILNFRKIRLDRAEPLPRKIKYFWNSGTVLYTAFCLVMIVLATVGY